MYKDQIKNCPYCDHKASVKEFMTWEKDDQRGLLGKTPDGFIMILCPNCKEHIKYDSLSNNFLKKEEKSSSGKIFNSILAIVVFAILYGLYRLIF